MPREPLKAALATPERKHRYVARLFDTIADDYDFITRLLSYGRDQHWKRRLIALAAIQPGERVLDLACGTGDLAVAALSSAHQDSSAAASSMRFGQRAVADHRPEAEVRQQYADHGPEANEKSVRPSAQNSPPARASADARGSGVESSAFAAAATASPAGLAATGANGPFVVGLDFTPRMIKLARARERAANSEPPASNPAGLDAADRAEARSADFAHADGLGSAGAGASAAARAGRRVTWLVGDMMALPFPSASFDVITTGYGFRNVPVLDDAIREAARVLRPGGRLFSLDFNRPQPALLRAAYLAYLTVVGSTVGIALHRDPDTYRYIPESIRRYPGAAAVVDRFRAAGFAEARWIPVLGGLMAIHIARK